MNCTPNVRHHLTFGGAFLMAKFTVEEKLIAVPSQTGVLLLNIIL
jgi:hypothetical protein